MPNKVLRAKISALFVDQINQDFQKKKKKKKNLATNIIKIR